MSRRPDSEKSEPRRLPREQSPPPHYGPPSAQQHGTPPPPQYYGPPHPNQQYMQGQMHMNPSFNQGHMMPTQHHTTTVVVNQPPSIQNDRILGPRDGHRDWSSGLFSCCDDVGKCMWAMYCPYCVLADISAKTGECALVTCCVPGGLVTIRTRVRTLGGIRGSICKDYIATTCCQYCVMCQIHRELEYMGL